MGTFLLFHLIFHVWNSGSWSLRSLRVLSTLSSILIFSLHFPPGFLHVSSLASLSSFFTLNPEWFFWNADLIKVLPDFSAANAAHCPRIKAKVLPNPTSLSHWTCSLLQACFWPLRSFLSNLHPELLAVPPDFLCALSSEPLFVILIP